MPTTVTSEASDKSRMATMTCVSKVIEHIILEIPNSINTLYVVSNGRASVSVKVCIQAAYHDAP